MTSTTTSFKKDLEKNYQAALDQFRQDMIAKSMCSICATSINRQYAILREETQKLQDLKNWARKDSSGAVVALDKFLKLRVTKTAQVEEEMAQISERLERADLAMRESWDSLLKSMGASPMPLWDFPPY